MPLLHVVERVGERPFGDAQRLGADPRARAIEHRQRELEAGALFAKPVGHRHLDVLEDDLRRR